MNIVKLSEISTERITVKVRSFVRYVHQLRSLTVQSRRQSAFMCVVDGAFHYQFDDGELSLVAGDILYLPEGGHYRYRVSGRTECLQIEAEISVDGQRAAFFDHPVKLTHDLERMHDLMESLEHHSGEFEITAAVFTLLGTLSDQNAAQTPISARILPAVQYLDSHFHQPICTADLAALCHISQSQMRRLFRQELAMSPIEYKNRRRMEAACNMLRYTYHHISEIAYALGFDNVYIFSRTFHKHFGCSPSQYRKGCVASDD